MRVSELGRDTVLAHLFRPEHFAREIAGRIVRQRLEVVATVEPIIRIPTWRASPVTEIVRAIEMPLADVTGFDAGLG